MFLRLESRRRKKGKAMLKIRLFAALTAVFTFAAQAQQVPVDRTQTMSATTPLASEGLTFLQSGEVHFKNAVRYNSTGPYVGSVAVGDFNGDGQPDLVLTSLFGVGTLMLGNGDGTFQNPISFNSGGGSSGLSGSIQIADVNGDGQLDLVIANGCVDTSCYPHGVISVLLGNGDGTFQPPVNLDSGGYSPGSVSVGDLNGDGYPDLVVADWCQAYDCMPTYAGGAGVLLGNGDGTFRPVVFYSAGYLAVSAAIADLNHDGHPDLVVVNRCLDNSCSTGHGAASILLGNGDGTFQPAVLHDSGAYNATSVAIGDLNGDGRPDLVVTNRCQDSSCGSGNGAVSVMLGNGDGTFQLPVIYSTGGFDAVSVAIADVNGGAVDLIIADHCKVFSRYCSLGGAGFGGVSFLIGNGDGTFQAPISLWSGGNGANQVAVSDLNHDGRPDIVLANECSTGNGFSCPINGTVGVVLNNLSAPARTTITTSTNPSLVTQPVTLTAAISSTPPIPDGEIVTFYDGATPIGTAATTAGTAALTTSFSRQGTHNVRASYPGDLYHKGAPAVIKQIVD
jgi:Bacterial Ig-like domain (group 3)/FG-GAP-like repeat